VYCRAEHEVGDEWVVVPLQYVDDYERRDDQWYFRRRKILVWFETDALTRPASARSQRRQWPGRAPAAADLPVREPRRSGLDRVRIYYALSPKGRRWTR